MGAKSFIVRGLGNAESFCSCSHGAGRVMSRTEAKRRVSLDEHKRAVAGVECRVDEAVIDETPSAYKPIDKVMAAQSDLGGSAAYAEAGGVCEGVSKGRYASNPRIWHDQEDGAYHHLSELI